MTRSHHEPLSPEERALADRLARLGPHDGPSPALDAKILAAAHAAVAPARRRRWLGLTAIPGGLITGAGMAATLVVVVGLVWQLRPSSPTPQLPPEEGDMGYVSAQILERAPPAPPPPPPPVDAPQPQKALQPPRQTAAAVARRKVAPAAAAAAPASDAHEHYLDEAIAPASAPAPAPAMAPPAAPPAPEAYAETASQADMAQAAGAQEQARDAAVARQLADDSAARSARRERSEAAVAAKAVAAPAEASPTLDRIEVTGSRVKSADVAQAPLNEVPVSDDARLDAKAWLKRIRARRDAGDLDGARESLERFRLAHPDTRVPRDLRELAASPTR